MKVQIFVKLENEVRREYNNKLHRFLLLLKSSCKKSGTMITVRWAMQICCRNFDFQLILIFFFFLSKLFVSSHCNIFSGEFTVVSMNNEWSP